MPPFSLLFRLNPNLSRNPLCRLRSPNLLFLPRWPSNLSRLPQPPISPHSPTRPLPLRRPSPLISCLSSKVRHRVLLSASISNMFSMDWRHTWNLKFPRLCNPRKSLRPRSRHSAATPHTSDNRSPTSILPLPLCLRPRIRKPRMGRLVHCLASCRIKHRTWEDLGQGTTVMVEITRGCVPCLLRYIPLPTGLRRISTIPTPGRQVSLVGMCSDMTISKAFPAPLSSRTEPRVYRRRMLNLLSNYLSHHRLVASLSL